MDPNFVLFFLLFLVTNHFLFPGHVCGEDERYSNCKTSFSCGNISGIGYPFWRKDQPDYCGHPGFMLDCEGDKVTMDFSSRKYQVIDINQETRILKIVRSDFQGNICPNTFVNVTLDLNHFAYTGHDENITFLYDCAVSEYPAANKFPCAVNNMLRDAYFEVPEISQNREAKDCGISLMIPVVIMAVQGLMNGSLNILDVINEGFELRWILDPAWCRDCISYGGHCGFNKTRNEFRCFCPDGAYAKTCPVSPAPASYFEPRSQLDSVTQTGGINWRVKILIGVVAGLVGILATCIAFYLCQRHRKKQNAPPFLLSRNISSDLPSVADVEKQTSCYGVSLFTYAELEEATNNFDSARELGDGGFGTVYYGKLRDGRAVAVKRLFENNCKRVEQFMNEVEILTRLRHQHLVSLYGSTSRHSRELLLVYEYVPKGTVADHLHGEHAKPGALPWPIRLKIATETASALTYLHATDIIHRDVKTNNILLDNNFSVKVADFGLSRLFPTDVTHVSTAPQGTPGYVDPEYHQCYQLTDKSDVFSFGVVLIELISSKPAVDITRHRHEINLSNMAINKIQNHALHELVDPSLGFESDSKVREMITAVAELAFQCLQNEKDMRPNMIEVLQCLTRIQSEGYNTENAEEMDVPSDDVVLLKSGPLPVSPDSVTVKWVSRSTTSDASN